MCVSCRSLNSQNAFLDHLTCHEVSYGSLNSQNAFMGPRTCHRVSFEPINSQNTFSNLNICHMSLMLMLLLAHRLCSHLLTVSVHMLFDACLGPNSRKFDSLRTWIAHLNKFRDTKIYFKSLRTWIAP